MKRIKRIIVMLTLTVMTAAMLFACAEDDGNKVTITFMNGETELGTVEATSGELLSADDYSQFESVDGFEFNGWFATASFKDASAKDLTKDAFDADTILYGDFKNTNVTEDTRKWYVVGDSSTGGILKESGWGSSTADDDTKAMFELQATGNTANEFALTIDLYQDDVFQIIHDWAFDGQKGFGAITEYDASQFEQGDGLGDNKNIVVLMDGNYTITVTTDPDNASQDTIVIVRNGDPTEAAGTGEEEETKYEVNENTKVIVKGSWVADWSDQKELTRGEGNTYSITMDMEADTEFCFSVFDGDTDTGIVLKEPNATDADTVKLLSSTGGNNLKIGADGTYVLTVNLDDNSVVITQ